jgi:hypothetical protein
MPVNILDRVYNSSFSNGDTEITQEHHCGLFLCVGRITGLS